MNTTPKTRSASMLLAVAAAAAMAASAALGAGAPAACATFTQADALAWLGGPLGAVDREDDKPQGGTRLTRCAYFSPGFSRKGNDAPPERGVYVTLISMPDEAAASHRFERMTEPPRQTGGPPTTATAVSGVGDQAVLEVVQLEAGQKMVRLKFVRGAAVVVVQVWSKSGDPAAIARKAAAKVVARLP